MTLITASAKAAIKDAVLDELSVRHLRWFVRQMWEIVEPGIPLDWNWHIDVICNELEAVTRGERAGETIVICIPPGHMKSLLVSVFWPAWQWLHRPTERTLHISNDDDLVKRDSRRTRAIIGSAAYQRLLLLMDKRGIKKWDLANDQNEKANFENDHKGFRQCMSIGAAITGKRADGLVIDDPYDAKDVLGSLQQVAKAMRDVVQIYDTVLSSRLNDKRKGYRVIIMQRLHQGDLAGVLIARGHRAIVLPTEYDPDSAYEHDPRRVRGELLFPVRFTPDVIAEAKIELGSRGYAAQHLQIPVPAAGGLFETAWFRRYNFDPQKMVMDLHAITIDCNFKKGDNNDFVVMQVWGKRNNNEFYLLDQFRDRVTYKETKKALKALRLKWPRVSMILIEEAANGPALISDLQDEAPGVIGYSPGASKIARAQLVLPYVEAGNVFIPDEECMFATDWLFDWSAEVQAFPAVLHDDQVDAMTQILLKWTEKVADTTSKEKMNNNLGWLNQLSGKRRAGASR